jgi:hypothetical protein
MAELRARDELRFDHEANDKGVKGEEEDAAEDGRQGGMLEVKSEGVLGGRDAMARLGWRSG